MDRPFDIIVFGAYGVTGKFVIEELAVHVPRNIKWAVAGRNDKKLRNALAEASRYAGQNLDRIQVVIAETGKDSMAEMCKQTKVVLNCVGPFRFHGENVVQACVAYKTHYVDVSGEPQFLENIQLKYFKEAQNRRVYVVGACGFDSIPCEMGVEFVKQNFNGDVNSIESYLEFHTTKSSQINYGTWVSAIHSLANAAQLRPLRNALRKEVFPRIPAVSPLPLKKRGTLFKSKEVNKWCLPFLGSDKSVVSRTQLFNYQFKNERPVQIEPYFCVSSFWYGMLFILFGGMFVLLSQFAFGRSLLEKYPGFFSFGTFTKDPPKREEMVGGSFSMTMCANGWSNKINADTPHESLPDKKMKVVIRGPDAGYICTSICAVNSCLVLLDAEERKKMPRYGGVFSPGAVFGKTKLIDMLRDRGFSIKVVQ